MSSPVCPEANYDCLCYGNSLNMNFNTFQSIVGFFCDSKCTPEIVCEMLAHMGISVSVGATWNMVKSLHKHANICLKTLPPGNMIYDIFDMDFKVAQPVAGHDSMHMSATSVTFAPYPGTTLDDLQFTKELHETSIFNRDLRPTDPKIYKPTAFDLLPPLEPISDNGATGSESTGLDALWKAFAWHMRAILVEQEPAFRKYQCHLGMPEAIDVLPMHKTEQFPANAINANEGQNDPNWEVLKILLDQVNITVHSFDTAHLS